MGPQRRALLVGQAHELESRTVTHRLLLAGRGIDSEDEAAHDAAAEGEIPGPVQGQVQHLHGPRPQDAADLHEGTRLREVHDGSGTRLLDLSEHVAVKGDAGAASPLIRARIHRAAAPLVLPFTLDARALRRR